MPGNSENNLITAPKIWDNWLKKCATVMSMLFLAYLFATPENIKYVLAVVAGYVLINDFELRHRALMINIMDHQLILGSQQATKLEQQCEVTSERVSELEIALENLKAGHI